MSNTPAEKLAEPCAYAHDALAIPTRLHLMSCSTCRVLAQQKRLLDTRSRHLPLGPTPTSLRTRVLDAVNGRPAPEPFQPDVPDGARKPLPRKPIAIGVGALCVAAGGYVAAPAIQAFFHPNVAAQVQAASKEARTWHFTGWRLEEGKRVKWEVWGRHAPYFYREEIGDYTLLDNNGTRTQILPPGPSRPHGLVLSCTGQNIPALNGLNVRNAGFLANMGYGIERFRNAHRANGQWVLTGSVNYIAYSDDSLQNTFGPGRYVGDAGRRREEKRVEEQMVVRADARTKLPVHYSATEVQYALRPVGSPIRSKDKGEITQSQAIAELDTEYNISIPPQVEQVQAPSSYPVFDLTEPPTPETAERDFFTSGGVTVKAKAIAQDAEGNLRVQIRLSLKDKPLPLPDYPGMIGVMPQRQYTTVEGASNKTQWGIVDDLGRRYVVLYGPAFGYRDGRYPDTYFAPLEPIRRDAPRAQKLFLSVGFSSSMQEWTREMHSKRTVGFPSGSGKLTVALPTVATTLDYDKVPPQPRGLPPRRDFVQTLALQVAEQRAAEYQMLAMTELQSKPERRAAYYRAAIPLFEEAARLAKAQPNGASYAEGYIRSAESARTNAKAKNP